MRLELSTSYRTTELKGYYFYPSKNSKTSNELKPNEQKIKKKPINQSTWLNQHQQQPKLYRARQLLPETPKKISSNKLLEEKRTCKLKIVYPEKQTPKQEKINPQKEIGIWIIMVKRWAQSTWIQQGTIDEIRAGSDELTEDDNDQQGIKLGKRKRKRAKQVSRI